MLTISTEFHADKEDCLLCSPAEQVFAIKELALYIINDTTMDHPYINALPKSLRGIRLLSKDCFKWCQLFVEKWQSLRAPLCKQFNALETAGISDANVAVQMLIDNQLQVANLSEFEKIIDRDLISLFTYNPHVKHLNIASSKISVLSTYTNLETLHGNKMHSLENFQGSMPMLRALKIKQMTALYLPTMQSLTTLDLTDCFYLETLPSLPKLQQFTCHKNRALCSFAEEGFPELRWLKISNCPKLASLGAALPALIKLIWRDDACEGSTSATAIKLPHALPNLESLECERLVELPELAPNLLTFQGSITKLPLALAHIVELNLQFSTTLNFFPPELPNLRKLNLSHTFIRGIKITAPQLKEFDCSYCHFIHYLLGEFEALEHLNCYENYQLIRLPPQLPKLKWLSVSECIDLENWPHMPVLETLCCSRNLVKELPENLLRLKRLSCQDSQLRALPHMPCLEELDYQGSWHLKVNLADLPADCEVNTGHYYSKKQKELPACVAHTTDTGL